MIEVTLNSYSAFTIPFVGVHKKSGRIVRSDGYLLTKNGLWTKGSKHQAKGSKITYMRVRAGTKRYMMHVLVAETFLKNTERKPTVDHKDRDPLNNDVFNLRYADYFEQARNTKSYLSAPPIAERIELAKKHKHQYYLANAERIKKRSKESYIRRHSS